MDQGTSASTNMDELNLLDYCRVVWKRRGFIGALCIGSVLISAVYSLWVPKIYRATAKILPPTEIGVGIGSQVSISLGERGGGSRGSLLDSLGSSGGLLSLSPSTPTRDIYLALLQSRTMQQEMIRHFKKKWSPSVNSLIMETDISSSKRGIISVTVEAQDPGLSAEVANFFFENLSGLMAKRMKTTSTIKKDYYERQLNRTKLELKKAQDDLIRFQEKNRYIALDPATKSAIAAGAINAGSVMALEMELNIQRKYYTDQHPQLIALKQRIYEAKRLVSHQLYGDPQPLPPESPGAPPRQEFFVAKAKMTPLQFKLMDVYRELTFRQSIESTIHQNIESLKYSIDNPASVYIDWLDRAIPPGEPFTPIISYNIAVAGVGSLIIGILLAFFLEYIMRLRALDQLKQLRVNSE